MTDQRTVSSRGRRAWMGAVAALVLAAAWLVAATSAFAFSANAQGSVEQVYVTGLTPGGEASLLGSGGETVSTQTADADGGLVFRKVTPGKGYKVKELPSGEESGEITVHTQAAKPWDPTVYKQTIPSSGYGYLTTRDGTQLAIDVHPPGFGGGVAGSPFTSAPAGKKVEYPTLIEYAGYGYANPAGPESGLAAVANAMGFAVVDVNMRGTGCSGGAFDYFEPLENLDAYDVIETIAKQPWVLNHKVGMFGISYGGISQLFAAQERPPAPRGDRPAVGGGRDGHDPVPGRRPQHRLRRSLGRRTPGGRRTGRPHQRRALGLRTDPERRHDLCGQPGSARRRHEPARRNQRKRDLLARPWPTRWTRSRSSTTSRCRRSWPASGRTSRPADTARTSHSTSPAPSASGSPSPTAPTSTRSTPRPSTACMTSWISTSRTRRRANGRRSSKGLRPRSTRRRWGSRKATKSRFRPTRSRNRSRTGRPRRNSKSSPRSACCSTTARDRRRAKATRRATLIPPSKRRSPNGRFRRRRARGTSVRKGRSTAHPRRPKGPTPTPRTRTPRR